MNHKENARRLLAEMEHIRRPSGLWNRKWTNRVLAEYACARLGFNEGYGLRLLGMMVPFERKGPGKIRQFTSRASLAR